MSFNLKSEELEAVSETACDFPLMKLLGQYSKESKENETKVDEFEKQEENAVEDRKENELDSVSLKEIEESGLKSLLDEAYSYKSPKDRVGKSSLFQELLNQVEENDGNKKVVDRNKEFISGLKTGVTIENGHDSASDKVLLNNILGSCDKEKKKKKKHKRDCSSSNNSSRKSKFNHLLNINHGNAGVSSGTVTGSGSPQSVSPYNGGNDSSGGMHFHASSRGLSRGQQSLSTRFGNSKAAAFLTSSSNIDMPMVTTYNKQPIMTPALVPSVQQQKIGEFCPQESADQKTTSDVDHKSSVPNDREIEMKVLRKTTFDDSVHSYMTRASLEIGEIVRTKDAAVDESSVCVSLAESSRILFPSQSSTALTNINLNTPIISSVTHLNGLLQEKVEIDSVVMNDDVPNHRTRSSTKDSTDNSRRFYEDGNSAFSHNYTFMSTTAANKDRLESGSDRKPKTRKPKKSPQASILSENIEGYCGDKSISYLLEYIESTNASNLNAKSSGGGNNVKSKATGCVSKNGGGDKHRGRASTDDDIRNPKKLPVKAKERLKKSTSLEDLRHVKSDASGGNGGKSGSTKQSFVDASHFVTTAASSAGSSKPASTEAVAAERVTTPTSIDYRHLLADERVYLDSLMLDDDNYMEESEFHLVTKKQRKKKRRGESRTLLQLENSVRGSGGDSCGYYEASAVGLVGGVGAAYKRTSRSSENRHRSRRKSVSSVVPSDKISDTDSIHSLPVSSTTPKCKVKKKSTSSGCTPQASYADIAKSPQCRSSTMLSGGIGSGDGSDSRWHKDFANSSSNSSSPSSSSSSTSCALPTAISSYSLACSSNTTSETTTDHAIDTPQPHLVPKCEGERVEFDGNCDRLSLTCNNSNVSNNSTLVGSSVNSGDQIKNSSCCNNSGRISDNKCGSKNGHNGDKISNNNSAHRSGNSCSSVSNTCTSSGHSINENIANVHNDAKRNIDRTHDSADIDVTLKCGHKMNRKTESDVNNDGATNASSTVASRKTKKKRSHVGGESVANATVENAGGDEMFVEFTLKCSTAVTSATSSSTIGGSLNNWREQDDSSVVAAAAKNPKTTINSPKVTNNVPIDNNEVSVEKTVVLKGAASKNVRSEKRNTANAEPAGSSLLAHETDTKVLVLSDAEDSRVSIQFDVDEELATNCNTNAADKCGKGYNGDGVGTNTVADSTSSPLIAGSASKITADGSIAQPNKRASTTVQRVNSEKSGNYNVAEVIQFVNKSWNEVMKTLSSAEVTDAHNKVRYYSAK